jgi:hypothetical protein
MNISHALSQRLKEVKVVDIGWSILGANGWAVLNAN